jgi:DNA-directed RNA polymerase specialized sigma24 family protein
MTEYDRQHAEFAKAAITGILAGKWGQMPQYKPEEAFAEFAFKIADEMMIALIKRRRQQYEPIE